MDKRLRLNQLILLLKKEKKKNKSQVAEDLGIKIQGLSNYINGVTPIGHKIASKIEEIYGVSRKWILCESDEMFLNNSINYKDSGARESEKAGNSDATMFRDSGMEYISNKPDKNQKKEWQTMDVTILDKLKKIESDIQGYLKLNEFQNKNLSETLSEVKELTKQATLFIPKKKQISHN